jgi:hypothetical protein
VLHIITPMNTGLFFQRTYSTPRLAQGASQHQPYGHWPVLTKGQLNSLENIQLNCSLIRVLQAKQTQMPSPPATLKTPGWGEVIEAKSLTQSLMPTAGFEPGTSWLLVRDPSHNMAPSFDRLHQLIDYMGSNSIKLLLIEYIWLLTQPMSSAWFCHQVLYKWDPAICH